MSNLYFKNRPYLLSAVPRNRTKDENLLKTNRSTCRGRKFTEREHPYHRPREIYHKYQHDDSHHGSHRRETTSSVAKVRVTNLDQGVVADDMRELFAEFGPLKDVSIYYKYGKSLGFADVIFDRFKDAENAIKKYNNVFLDGMPMKMKIVSPLLPIPNLVKQQNYEYFAKENSTIMSREKRQELQIRSKSENISTGYGNRLHNENFKKRININLRHEESQINQSYNRQDKDILNRGKGQEGHGQFGLSNMGIKHNRCYKQGMLSTSKYENSSVVLDKMHDYENLATLQNSCVRQYREESCESFTRSPYSTISRSRRQSHQNFIRPSYTAASHDREQSPRNYGSSSNCSISHYEQLHFQNPAKPSKHYNREKKQTFYQWKW